MRASKLLRLALVLVIPLGGAAACASLGGLIHDEPDASVAEDASPTAQSDAALAHDSAPAVDADAAVAPDAADAAPLPSGFCDTFDGGPEWKCDDFDKGTLAPFWSGLPVSPLAQAGITDAAALSPPYGLHASVLATPNPSGAYALVNTLRKPGHLRGQFDVYVDRHDNMAGAGCVMMHFSVEGFPDAQLQIFPASGDTLSVNLWIGAVGIPSLGLVQAKTWLHFTFDEARPASDGDGGTCVTLSMGVNAHQATIIGCSGGGADESVSQITFGAGVGSGGGDWSFVYDNVAFTVE